MKILAVEDNPADFVILQEFLEPQNDLFDLQNVKTLELAKKFLSDIGSDFVLLDLGLPDSQGIATFRELHTLYPHVPIVVFTGFDDDETGVIALREGAQDYLVKGQITGPSLVRSIRYADERNRIERELIRKNQDLDMMNEKLVASEEELRQNLDDISRNEAELRKAGERLASAQEIAHLGSWELDLTTNRLFWSDEVYRIFGLKPQEFGATYEAFLEAVHPDDRVAVDTAYSGSIRDKKDSYEIEHRIVRRNDGQIRYVSERCNHIRDEAGHIIQSVGMVHDITRRKLMEAENIRAREEWERTFNTVPDLISILDLNHRIIRMNKAMAERLGKTSDTCIGLLCYEVVHNTTTPPDFCPHILTCMNKKEHIEEIHDERLGGDFIVSTTPLLDNSGNVIGSVHVARDITDRKRAEFELEEKNQALNTAIEELSTIRQELQNSNDDLVTKNAVLTGLNQKLQETQKELNDHIAALLESKQELMRSERDLTLALSEKEVLLSEIHHRVKNNLTAFISLMSLEESYAESPAGRAFTLELQNRARTMALVHETLYKTGKYSNVYMEEYLSTLVEQVVNSYCSDIPINIMVESHGITLDLARATPIGLIINEIITNSMKYAFPDGVASGTPDQREPCTIRVSLSNNAGKYLLKVSDNGIGLPPDIDITSTKTLGLKLVNFLSKHQVRAEMVLHREVGTEFVFRFDEVEQFNLR